MRPLAALFWLFFCAAMAVYVTMLAWTLPGIAAAAGGLPPFDMRPAGYSAEEARAFLAALTAEGRALYLGPQARLDLAYPGLAATTLILAFRLLLPPGRTLWIAACLFSLAAAGFDYLENARVHDLLTAEPASLTNAAIARASFATLAKSITSTVAYSALLIALGARIWQKLRQRRR